MRNHGLKIGDIKNLKDFHRRAKRLANLKVQDIAKESNLVEYHKLCLVEINLNHTCSYQRLSMSATRAWDEAREYIIHARERLANRHAANTAATLENIQNLLSKAMGVKVVERNA